jgi:hypothetical protein
VNLINDYIIRSAEIIGERTPAEEKYDREILRWIEKGKPIRKAIDRANIKYPKEALLVDDSLLPDLQSRYEYMLEHEKIMRNIEDSRRVGSSLGQRR